ncbi:translation initiation factor IF-2 [Oligosphaera ethanolica]|uniref:Translation initiation factor IF-2 n=1 Tax=Oligosphaera ethanolica TaxID=760260 RepID=A0AAE4AQJ0_9BACT|nr:translation initiation factor IF-2 [Oligosphaera ethanolica]MDQ0290487.1 translation initiation factor IF-2 [Oligosphaera ethanolica]
MSDRVRVYELARELGLTNKELMALLENEGCAVRSHSSTLEADTADLIRDLVIAERQKEQQKKADNKPPAPPAPPVPVAKTGADKPVAKPAAKPVEKAVIDKDAAGKKAHVAVPPRKVDADATDESGDDEEAAAVVEEAGAKELHLKAPITVRDLAEGLGKKPNELIGLLMTMNIFAAINQVLDVELVEKICERHGVVFVRERREKGRDRDRGGQPGQENRIPLSVRPHRKVGRPPVVVFMGHVDHGKTSLQDYIRHSHVTSGEAGGITQHIGASVATVGDQTITFLDTPGHEAFTAMRARGANATDIAVLVVAADDGVMPQTVEAINHAKAANLPIVVAMNKMDLPAANPDKVLLGLQQHGITPRDWGGETEVLPVSAHTGVGINELLEQILLEAEMLELNADPDAPFEGLVIEAQMETGMGPTAHVLVRNGTLKLNDAVICGQCYGRVRALIDSQGRRVQKASPSMPVKVMGLSSVPNAGDKILACANEREARVLAEEAMQAARQGNLSVERMVTLDDMFSLLAKEEKPELPIILKTDVRGSLEAITDCIAKLKSDRISAHILHSGVGEISENDVVLAAASKAVILGFHVRVMPGVNRFAKQKGVDVRLYSIIYELLQEVEKAMRGRLQPDIKETPLGEAEIIQVFEVSKAGKICGSRVNSGVMRVNAKAKVYRDKELIYHGQVQSLKRYKDDVREVHAGLECGIRLDNFEDFEVGDKIELFEVVEIAPEL